MLKRLFDILISFSAILILCPLLIIIWIWVVIDSKGGGIYRQKRVGQYGNDFWLYKFRTMHIGADKKQLITIGDRDSRITRAGYLLRKYKLDELPQLFNVLKGNMSMVGPRPEVRKYVDLYNEEQLKVLHLKPGITDYASIAYINESELLSQTNDPERVYIEKIMPKKIKLNQKYIQNSSLITDIKILTGTLRKIIFR